MDRASPTAIQQITVRLPLHLLARVDAYARRTRRSRNQTVAYLLEQALAAPAQK